MTEAMQTKWNAFVDSKEGLWALSKWGDDRRTLSWAFHIWMESREPKPFNFRAHLANQAQWSEKTFGPGARVWGVVNHIRAELKEIEANPGDLEEWIDVVILALDGAWRSGASPTEIIDALVAKQAKNEGRKWPDWRTMDPNQAIEHDRSQDGPA